MREQNIGYKPEKVIKPTQFAEMLQQRKAEPEVETTIKLTNLNHEDEALASMNDTFFDALANKMAEKSVSGLDLSTSL
ncbi:MAG: hypothetical protein WC784_04090 [Candidatus Shapirobacteria bacterium]|jgi:hypothetical protein